jgi:hypothetical protein
VRLITEKKLSDKISSKNNILTVILERPKCRLKLFSVRDTPEMVGKSKDPKGTRITVRISENDLRDLQNEARRRNCTVGAVVRYLIRENLAPQSQDASVAK